MRRCCFLFCYFVKFCSSIRRPFWLSDIDLCFWSILCIIAKYCIGHWKQQDICSQKHGSILLPVSFWLRKVIYPLRSISHFDQFFNWDNSAPSEWWWENQMAKKWMLFFFFLNIFIMKVLQCSLLFSHWPSYSAPLQAFTPPLSVFFF